MSGVTVVLDGGSLPLADLVRVAGGAPVEADPVALDRMRGAARAADAVALLRDVYGRSTGVGANRTVALDPDSPDAGLALLRSHAVSAGRRRSRQRVRATLVVRANQLLAGGSGASAEVAAGLVELLTHDVVPDVRELGGLGTGDLGALATIGLALADRGVAIGMRDALPLMSSNAASIADAALAVQDLDDLAVRALDVAAVTFAAVEGNAEAFATAVERVSPFEGTRRVARTMRTLTAGTVAAPARIQDPFALRTLPQVHGALLDALARAADTVNKLVNAPTENPLFDVADVSHHGGFHAAALTVALDAVRLATLAAARLARARLGLLCEPAMTSLSAFLAAPDVPGASGVLGLEYVAGSALGDLHLLAAPAAGVSVSISRGVEEDASFASLSARAALASVPSFRTTVATELLAGLRALGMHGRPVPERWAGLVADLDPDLADRDLTADLDRVDNELRTGSHGGAPAPGAEPGGGGFDGGSDDAVGGNHRSLFRDD